MKRAARVESGLSRRGKERHAGDRVDNSLPRRRAEQIRLSHDLAERIRSIDACYETNALRKPNRHAALHGDVPKRRIASNALRDVGLRNAQTVFGSVP